VCQYEATRVQRCKCIASHSCTSYCRPTYSCRWQWLAFGNSTCQSGTQSFRRCRMACSCPDVGTHVTLPGISFWRSTETQLLHTDAACMGPGTAENLLHGDALTSIFASDRNVLLQRQLLHVNTRVFVRRKFGSGNECMTCCVCVCVCGPRQKLHALHICTTTNNHL